MKLTNQGYTLEIKDQKFTLSKSELEELHKTITDALGKDSVNYNLNLQYVPPAPYFIPEYQYRMPLYTVTCLNGAT